MRSFFQNNNQTKEVDSIQGQLDKQFVTIYSFFMVKKEKLLEKARNSADSLSFGDFETLMTQFGWEFRRQRGSHKVWYSPKRYRLSLQDRNGKAKAYQVKQFLKQLEVEDEK